MTCRAMRHIEDGSKEQRERVKHIRREQRKVREKLMVDLFSLNEVMEEEEILDEYSPMEECQI